ncbi:TIGR04219 family outer membrane beta-barrel protein [Sulfurimonas sp. CVO]|jgi:outer membrane protein|uniref:TIGR04219 family outer membrane beta-barrel protein n=1 Tax=Sulfurimonas sp. CVO TaxID=2283483 RepID=UPI00132F05F8|nr:TIGR04219 family outer membrane beta-barrel protein [Sulfurimonas sp. CVO]QHG91935.1 TIGR04219 family outer membrane beta-barrel protein [Sulfurimonas sp. CVO]
MKKVLYTFACGAVLASGVMADFARVEVGAGAWMQTPEGKVTYTENGADGIYTSKEGDSTEPYFWVNIKHPVPVLPNLRLEYVTLEDSGTASGAFKDFSIGSDLTSLSYDMKQYDIIPYYNILDNTAWITLDLGLDIKIMDVSYSVAPVGLFTGYSDDFILPVPLLYARGRFEIPSTDIGLEADVKYITTGDSTVYDIRAKVDYTLDVFPVIQPALEVGYRAQKIDIDESDADAKLDIDYSGFYAGVMLRF